MVEVELSRIIIDEKSQEQVIVLKEKEGSRSLPIVIGFNEAAAIRMRFGGFNPPRPLTHDLLKGIIEALDAKLEKVVVDKLISGTFHAKLLVRKQNGEEACIDARPSDSIALAVRTGSPIFVKEEVFEKAAFGQ